MLNFYIAVANQFCRVGKTLTVFVQIMGIMGIMGKSSYLRFKTKDVIYQ